MIVRVIGRVCGVVVVMKRRGWGRGWAVRSKVQLQGASELCSTTLNAAVAICDVWDWDSQMPTVQLNYQGRQVPTVQLNLQGRARPTIANLYNWRYKELGDLPKVKTDPRSASPSPSRRPSPSPT